MRQVTDPHAEIITHSKLPEVVDCVTGEMGDRWQWYEWSIVHMAKLCPFVFVVEVGRGKESTYHSSNTKIHLWLTRSR